MPAKSGFLAEMGHEIRTPVSAILGYHDLLALKLEATLGPEEREHLRRATAAGQHLLRLVEEILDYARVEAQRVTVERRAFRLADPVAAALDLVGEQARARRLDLVDAVSGSAAEVRCTGDEHRVRQIFINLVANATRLTAAGGRITVSAGTAVVPSPDAVLARGTAPGSTSGWRTRARASRRTAAKRSSSPSSRPTRPWRRSAAARGSGWRSAGAWRA